MGRKLFRQLNNSLWKCCIPILYNPCKVSEILDPLRCDNAVLCKVSTQGIHRLRPLSQQ